MAYYRLYDGSTYYNFDSNMEKIDLGIPGRKYRVMEYAGAAGGKLKGQGQYKYRKIRVTKKLHNISGNTTWDSTRDSLFAWINKANWETLYFDLTKNDGSTQLRTRVYPDVSGNEAYSFVKVSDTMTFDFYAPNPYFKNISSSTGTESVTDSSEHSFSVTNNGNAECPVIIKYTPTADQTSFQCEIANNFGIKVEKASFLAGEEITINTGTGAMTIAGSTVGIELYWTAGGLFFLRPGSNTLYVTCSGAGSFGYEFYERYI